MSEQDMQMKLALQQGQVNVLRREVAEMTKEREYWTKLHHQAAIAAMQGMITNPQTYEQIEGDKGYDAVGDKTKIIAIASVMYADAVIKELQKKDNVYAEARRLAAIDTASMCENLTNLRKKGVENEND